MNGRILYRHELFLQLIDALEENLQNARNAASELDMGAPLGWFVRASLRELGARMELTAARCAGLVADPLWEIAEALQKENE